MTAKETDPERSARAKKAWDTRRARAAARREQILGEDKKGGVEPQETTQPGPTKENKEGETNPYVEPSQEVPQNDGETAEDSIAPAAFVHEPTTDQTERLRREAARLASLPDVDAEHPLKDEDRPLPKLPRDPVDARVAELESEVRIAKLESELAALKGKTTEDKMAATPDSDYIKPADDPDADIVLHFLEDGFTSNGKMYYRGEEFRVKKDSEAYRATLDRNNNTWIDLSTEEQIARYGKVMFGNGPWPHSRPSVSEAEDEYNTLVAEGDVEQVRRYEKKKQREQTVKVGV